MYNSACFYKHFSIDWEQLVKNLNNDAELARKTVECFIEAAAKAHPSGKQHAFAAFNPPDGVLVEVKVESKTPISYANAFADPVPQESERRLIGESIARLGQYAHELIDGYEIEAQRFWFSPCNRYSLQYISKDDKKEHKVTDNEFGKFGEFVEQVMNQVNATSKPQVVAQ